MAVALLGSTPALAQDCPPAGHTKQTLLTLRAQKFALPDPAAKRQLSTALLACLGDPDPALRDEVAYEALTEWMRRGELGVDVLRDLRDRLVAMLGGDPGPGFRQPFAALVLAEIARTDRVGPGTGWMTPAERTAMVERAAMFVESVSDYRGYADGEGWRHGVAHGADWLMQLALNPSLERVHYDRLLSAVAAQAVPARGHAYIFGEPGRLARPVLFAASRGLVSTADWTTWFAALVSRLGKPGPGSYAAWQARRHDLIAFLMSAYVDADLSDDANIRALEPAIVSALKAVQ